MTKARDISKLLSTANGKIAGENLDVSFENITDTGTEGTRVATGTSAERGSTAGQFRFNSTTGKFEGYNGSDFKEIDSPPTVSSVGASNITQSDIESNYDLSITGTNFVSGATVKFVGNDGTEYASPTVTVNSATSITARIPTSVTNTNEPFDVKVVNANGLTGSLSDAFNVDGAPVWQTASGNIGNVQENTSANLSVSATDPEGDTVSYAETGGTVLTTNGFSLNSSTGAITGTAPTVTDATTYTFDIRATSGTNIADRTFNILVVNPPSGGDFTNTYTYGGVSYKIHKFTSDGGFLLEGSKDVDFLIIGGGGGAGQHSGAGGGAGGLVWLTNQTLTAGTHTATIGAGGQNSGDNDQGNDGGGFGAKGSNSSFASKIALGGGGGGYQGGTDTSIMNGGCGGGSSRTQNSPGTSIQFSTYGYGQGFDGAGSGANGGANNYAAYAGGGTGQAGQIRTGGDGSSTFVNSSSAETTAFLLASVAGTDSSNNATTSSSSGTLYIGGGGGGSDQANISTYFPGGKGGGGRGNSNNNSPTGGLVNTGSGSGGQSYNNSTAYTNLYGGSGIVIVRYEI